MLSPTQLAVWQSELTYGALPLQVFCLSVLVIFPCVPQQKCSPQAYCIDYLKSDPWRLTNLFSAHHPTSLCALFHVGCLFPSILILQSFTSSKYPLLYFSVW